MHLKHPILRVLVALAMLLMGDYDTDLGRYYKAFA